MLARGTFAAPAAGRAAGVHMGHKQEPYLATGLEGGILARASTSLESSHYLTPHTCVGTLGTPPQRARSYSERSQLHMALVLQTLTTGQPIQGTSL